MIRLLGNPKTLCDGLTRRDLLHLGGLSLFGLNLADFSRLQAAQTRQTPGFPAGSFGRAKSCILVYLVGAPPQHETFDPKPDAPTAIQGELKAIPSAVPGVPICELLPRFAELTDRLTIVRSMTHEWPFHAVNYALAGIPQVNPKKESDPNARSHATIEQSPRRRRPRTLVASLFGVPGGRRNRPRPSGWRKR